jgi:hypothetical protein
MGNELRVKNSIDSIESAVDSFKEAAVEEGIFTKSVEFEIRLIEYCLKELKDDLTES